MGEIDEGLERAEHTQPIPVHLATRVKFLWKKVAKEDTARLAEAVGISVRTAQRWARALKEGEEPTMSKANEKKVEQTVRQRWQPRVKNRVRKQAEKNGFILHVQAQFGYQSAAGSTDDPRLRTISQKLPGEVARRLYEARDAGASQARQEQLLADALQEHYFKDGGRRASGLVAEINGMNWMDVEVQ